MKIDRSVIESVSSLRDVENYSFIVDYIPPMVRTSFSEHEIFIQPSQDDSPTEVYVHIPDCPYICDFCSFFKLRQINEDERDRYVSAVKSELDIYLQRSNLSSRPVRSLFFGGGTPTRLNSTQFSELLNYLQDKLHLDESVEISSESTPDTLDNEILKTMRDNGVNRLSIGVQDFNDEVLHARRRGHTRQQAIDSYKRARTHGFDRINIDLIYRLPKQNLENWEHTLKITGELRPDYVTLYHLRKEQRTSLGKKDESEFPSREEAMEMYLIGLESLVDSGYIQISPNQFALPSKKFKQQEGKWSMNNELLGLGVSAYSFFNGCSYRNLGKFGNKRDLDDYIDRLNLGNLAVETGQRLSEHEKACRFAVFGIKTSGINGNGGINKKLFTERFGVPIHDIFEKVLFELEKDHLIKETAEFIRLTLGGLIVSEEISARFYSEEVKGKLKAIEDSFGRKGL